MTSAAQAMTLLEKGILVSEKIVRLETELAAVKSERDFLRALLEKFEATSRVSTQVADTLT